MSLYVLVCLFLPKIWLPCEGTPQGESMINKARKVRLL